MGFLFFVIVIVVGWQVLKLAQRQWRAADDAWLWAAEELGLRFENGGWLSGAKISGILQGGFVMVDTHSVSTGNSSQTYTRYEVGFAHRLNMEMKLTKQNAMTGVAKMFGAQDVEVGDRVFDDQVVVKVADRRAFKQYLTRERRKAICDAFITWPRLQIDDGAVRVSVAGKESDPATLVRTVRQLMELAQVVSERHAQSPARPSPPPPLRPVKATPPPIVVPPPITQSAPEPKPEPAPEEEAAPLPVGLQAAVVCADLYRKGQSGTESEKTFTEKYQGQSVQGVGVLRSAQRYSFDIVFGDVPAMRAMVDVFDDDSGGFGARTVQAAVKFPEDMRDVLTERSGQEVVFTGTLVKFDRLLRKLYVADGSFIDAS